jgi:hypothetical protein
MRTFSAICWAGLTCGVLDITAAFVTWAPKGVTPTRILQGIASGVLGPRSFSGGRETAAIGLGFHFLIAFSAATVFLHGKPQASLDDPAADSGGCAVWRSGLSGHVLDRHAAIELSQRTILLVCYGDCDHYARDMRGSAHFTCDSAVFINGTIAPPKSRSTTFVSRVAK